MLNRSPFRVADLPSDHRILFVVSDAFEILERSNSRLDMGAAKIKIAEIVRQRRNVFLGHKH